MTNWPVNLQLCLMLSAWICLLGSCTPDRGVLLVVSVENLPIQTSKLQLLTMLDQQLAFSQPQLVPTGHSPFEFALRLDRPYTGHFVLGIAARSESECILATGELSEDFAGNSSIERRTLVLEQWEESSAPCPSDGPVVRAVSPSAMSTQGTDEFGQSQRMELTGWGFHRDLAVRLALGSPLPIASVTPTHLVIEELPVPFPLLGVMYGTVSDPKTLRSDASFSIEVFFKFSDGVVSRLNPVVAAGLNASCALGFTGTVKCAGNNPWGELGNGSYQASITPGPVLVSDIGKVPVEGVIGLDGYGEHFCALLSSGGVRCWGKGGSGQIGHGLRSHALVATSPLELDGSGIRALAFAAGGSVTCAIVTGGRVLCWGANVYGQLGSGDPLEIFASPRQVKYSDGTELSDVVKIATGTHHVCVIKSDGKVFCWGWNRRGQVGNGVPSEVVPNPTAVQYGGQDFTAVEVVAGAEHTCARQASGKVFCWGYNSHGPLGTGQVLSTSNPTEARLSGAVSLFSGHYHTCAIRSDRKLLCWGYNADGQIGNGDKQDQLSPVEVVGLPLSAFPVSGTASDGYTCALFSDGSTRCWGDNRFGQFGNETTDSSNTPVVGMKIP